MFIEALQMWLAISVYSPEKGFFVAVFDVITERKRAETITQARLRIAGAAYTESMSINEILQLTLDEIERQTGSVIGFYHFLETDQETLSLQNWSSNTLRAMCTAEGKGSHYNISRAGVWVDCVRNQRPVIHNDYASLPHRKGMPPGHAPVTREMVIPILRGGRIVAIIGVGNKPTDYDATDIEIANLLGDFSWEIVERKRAEEELIRLNDELERRVTERTEDLAKTISALHSEVEDRTRAEQALRAERQRFNDVLETLPAYLVLLTQDYHVVFANRFFRERFGESHGRRCFEYLFERTEPCTVCETYKALETMTPHQWEWTGPDGRNYYIYDFPFIDTDGSTLVMEMGLDITEQKQAEESLRRSRESLKKAQAIAHVGSWHYDFRTGEMTWSDELYRIFGLDPAAFDGDLNAVVQKALHHEERHKVRRGIRQILTNSKAEPMEYHLLLSEGEVRTVWAEGEAVFEGPGKAVGILGTVQDITDRKRAEEEIVRLAAAVESAADAIVITEQGAISYVNPAFEKMTGYSRDEVNGRDLHMFDSGRHDETYFKQVREAVRNSGVWSGRLINKKKDGTLYEEECTYAPIRGRSGEILNYMAIKRDVTEKVRLESIAQAVDTMNNIGYIFSGVRHEIGNPVTTISMSLGLLLKKMGNWTNRQSRST